MKNREIDVAYCEKWMRFSQNKMFFLLLFVTVGFSVFSKRDLILSENYQYFEIIFPLWDIIEIY
jgi:hypothetical protein